MSARQDDGVAIHERTMRVEREAAKADAEVRCGTCKHWRPNATRDAGMNRHYGHCAAPLPAKIPACFDRSLGARWGVAHSAGANCTAWKAGGKHGGLS